MKKFDNLYKNIVLEQDNAKYVDKKMELKLSNNLASEFTQTLNEFTALCAKMVKERSIDKDTYDKFDDLHSKIKNIIDAGRNSN